ncbi:septal ring lytic transglycosylase RlpA family protein [uncultured Parasphingopyxis sp.]|uniref:septal ring lytic transglycosylase RlpA family protein n=1 Tax=uncultured Parasphingopyxis sp. TaxID=1547918 RepID=UPI00260B0971|nr:septal ring lytic transglycosylase RlpA family protein [uncultured Parasphingopyxis sp.]
MKFRASLTAASLAALTACAGGGGLDRLPPAGSGEMASVAAVSDMPVRVGPPYQVGGATYTPRDERYDQTGLASYYGNELAGRQTANGERFDPARISAAHRTLPLPSYVEVTSLDTGRTILVRINDRGPFSPDRIIDLSYGAAQQLGIIDRGTAPVRVRRVEPPEADRAALRSGRSAGDRMNASPQLLAALRDQFQRGGGTIPDAAPPSGANAANSAPPAATSRPPPTFSATSQNSGVTWQTREPIEEVAGSRPTPSARPAPVASGSGYFVQLGAFSNAANADRLARRAAQLGNVVVDTSGSVRRVRIGPYANSTEAQQALARARSAGYSDARIFRDR